MRLIDRRAFGAWAQNLFSFGQLHITIEEVTSCCKWCSAHNRWPFGMLTATMRMNYRETHVVLIAIAAAASSSSLFQSPFRFVDDCLALRFVCGISCLCCCRALQLQISNTLMPFDSIYFVFVLYILLSLSCLVCACACACACVCSSYLLWQQHFTTSFFVSAVAMCRGTINTLLWTTICIWWFRFRFVHAQNVAI